MAKSTGFAEGALPFGQTSSVQAVLGADGRLLIPAAVRDAAGIKRGDKVTLRVEDGRIVVSSARADWMRIVGLFADMKKPGESVVDEFLAEKYAEAARDSKD